jgi:hypothetical protein
MLRKLRSSRLRDAFAYLRGGDPRDEWEFCVGTRPCRFVNGWRSGAALLVDRVKVARCDKRISVRGDKPLVTAEVKDDAGVVRRVDVFVRAVSGVTIHVRIDGAPIQKDFI